MEWLVHTLRTYPEVAIFLTLAIGAYVGQFRWGSFSLGVVTSTLLAGVLVGQLGITISPNVKSTFFLMFLFAVGYEVGPQFFRGLKSGGLSQVAFSILVCVCCLATAVAMAKVMGYDVGLAAGLLSGACTISAVIGVASDSINQLSMPAEQKKALIDSIPIAYAVTYLYGTAGSAWFLATIGPKILGVNLVEACKELEKEMGVGSLEPGIVSGYRPIVARAYRLSNAKYAGKTVSQLEGLFSEGRVYVERVRRGTEILDADGGTVLKLGDVLGVAGRREAVLAHDEAIGEEIDDRELLDQPAEVLDVVVTRKDLSGRTLQDLAEVDGGRASRGIFLRKMKRSGVDFPHTLATEIHRGDVLTLAGAKRDVERAAKLLGYADRITESTDVLFMGLGIAIGAVIGALTVHVGGVPLSLSTSGGALIAGLVCGWLRSVHPTFGRIPGPAVWVFKNVGLNTFIAVVGISAGPGFVAGIQKNGLGLLLAGVVVTTVPFVIGLLAGKYIFKFHPAINLGACAGARTTTAALGQLQEAAQSKVPALGYTVTYAVGNTLLTIWGVAIVVLMT